MGDSDLTPPEGGSGAPQDLSGRGLVVFPAPGRPGRRNLGWYAPFLITIALGAAVVVAVVLIR